MKIADLTVEDIFMSAIIGILFYKLLMFLGG